MSAGEAVTGRRWRSARPRERVVVLSFPRKWIAPLVLIAVLAPIAAFAVGMSVGRRGSSPEPVVSAPEPVLSAPEPAANVAAPVAAVAPAPAAPPAAPAAVPKPEKIKLELIIGPQPKLTGWAIQIGAYPDLATAEAAARLHARALVGRKVYVIPTRIEGRGTWHRVRIDQYATRQDAEAAKRKLAGDLAKDAIVVSYK